MIHLNLEGAATRELQILCLGCHSDDIEIGCGGTILRLAQEYPNCVFHWVVFSATGVREAEAKYAAAQFVHIDHLKGPLLKTFADGFMPFVGAEVKAVFEELKQTISPDLIFTHHRTDAHQDHRLVAELTWNTFRNHLILEYEIPKYDGDMGQPSVFVPLEMDICQKKVRCIMEAFKSQHHKRWFQPDTFLSLMRLRGMECNAPSGHAEAFFCRKLTLGGEVRESAGDEHPTRTVQTS
ncbi:MAG TPA: PIG-L deacetylase family protein [Candidatus Acidoferrum sp.]|nr:PIG-L deacetylase family protein [Candidatus Acidoferrum sp.]